jgi:hypothetical protein
MESLDNRFTSQVEFNGQLMSSLLIFKCPMSHGTMKYTMKAHVCYFALMIGLLHSMHIFTFQKI